MNKFCARMVVVFCLLLFANSNTFSQSQKWKIRLTAKKDYLVSFLESSKIRKSFVLRRLVDRERIDDAKILAYKKVGSFYYMLVAYQHSSTERSDGKGYCGAGTEEYVVLLKFTKALRLVGVNDQQVYSCVTNIDNEYTFDKKYPEKGITLTDDLRP